MDTRPRNGIITEYNEPFIEQRADPYVYRHEDGSYYFTASVPEYDKIILRKSDSLLGLKEAEEVCIWEKHESGDMSKHIWAPELHYIDGRFYIYFAASREEDKWRLRPYILECEGQDPIHNKWIERGMIQRSDDDIYSFKAFSLDSTVFENKGQLYYVWAEKVSVGIGISNLYIAKMESPTKLSTEQVLLTTPDYDWERVDIWVNEGPAVIKKDGRIFLTYSASATGECYCMGMLSIGENEDLLDPRAWTKEKKPVLCSDRELGFYGPGHNSFTKLPDGRDVCVFHARTYKEIEGDPLYDPNRHTMLIEVKWDKDGRPVFDYRNKIR
ncbi:MAG: family 43 glycosylhydrolase [Butyrivibrio sp.]|nr:family 43 glycosylhydrolase [Butyrivibrio sp.]